MAPLGAWLASSAGCASADTSAVGASSSRLVESTVLGVDTARRHQRITGFGASSAWTGGSISEDTADQFFSAERGIGLSLLRMHITPEGDSSEMATARRAAARGVLVWAAPWSPPGEWKTSGTATNGGSLLPEYYQDWADRLASFAVTMNEAGVPLYALSAQNEPNWTAEWETCVYTPQELVTFVGEYLAPALEQASPDTKLLGPESIDWITLKQYADPLLADATTNAALDIVGVHAYGGTPFAYTAPAENGKEFWETEVSYDANTGQLAALETARQIQRHLVEGGVNAFHYWWLTSTSSGALMMSGELLPQAYALGHYSKFIRPGFVRVEVPAKPTPGVWSSAFFDPASHRTVLVLVNENSADFAFDLRVDGAAPIQVTPWVTREGESLAAHEPVAFESPFSYVLGAQTVVSLVLDEVVTPPVETGEGGAPSSAGAPSVGASGAGSDSGGEASSEPKPSAGSSGAGGRPVSNGPSAEGGGSDPTAITSRKRGEYMSCTLAAPARSGAPLGLFGSVALFAWWRARRSAKSAEQRSVG